MPIVVSPPSTSPSTTGERIILDPVDVGSERVPLDISTLVAVEGIDWGDAEIQAYQAEQERGQSPVDFRIPNRTVTIPFALQSRDGLSFEAVRDLLQAKATLFQREGGWLQRTTAVGTLYIDIVNATLKLSGGWFQAHRGLDTDAQLTLECIPDFYGVEVTLSDHVETTNPELTFIESTLAGNHPGRLRIVVDEDSGNTQYGLLWGIRSRHYDDATTARLAYPAESLTPLDTAVLTALTGATGSGSNTVRHNNLATRWTPVLSTQASGGGAHMTHTGSYRVWARVYSTSGDSTVTPPQVRLTWDVGDFTFPVENKAWQIPAANNFYSADLGEVRLDRVPTGIHRWQGVIQGKGGTNGQTLYVDHLWFQPLDDGAGRLVITPPQSTTGVSAFSARDTFDSLGNGTALDTRTADLGGTWSTSGAGGSGSTTDFAGEGTGLVKRSTTNDGTSGGGSGRLALFSATYGEMEAGGDFMSTAYPSNLLPALVGRYVDSNNFLQLRKGSYGSGNFIYLRLRLAGTEYVLGVTVITTMPNVWFSLNMRVQSSGHVFATVSLKNSTTPLWTVSGYHSALATGGVLDDGKFGFEDYNGSTTACSRYIDNVWAAAPSSEAVLFPNRSAELRWDGIFREDPMGVAFGPVPTVIGDLPRLPASGSEGRIVELFLKSSRGNFDQLPDAGIDDLSARLSYRPSWLTVPGS